jgi:hypothetical protein
MVVLDGKKLSDLFTTLLTNYNGEYTIELYDENTTLVRKIECGENTPYLQIPVSGLTPGYYYLRLIINNQLIDVKQVIIN